MEERYGINLCKNMKKIAITVFLAFIISFSIFTYFQNIFNDELSVKENEFFSRSFNQTEPKILLLGSSHVGMLDGEYLESIIHEQYPQYTVFNLSDAGDTPEKRSSKITRILELKPEIIVYGIGYRDFSNKVITDEKLLPDPDKFFVGFLEKLDSFSDNPKFNTLNAIRNTLGIKSSITNLPNTPFFHYESAYDTVFDLNELENQFNHEKKIVKIDDVNSNYSLKLFRNILKTFEENNIKTIIFVTPHNLHYFKNISEQDKQNFDGIIEELTLNQNVSFTSLMLNYSQNNVWASTNHVTHGIEGRIYAQDVSNIILQEIKK